MALKPIMDTILILLLRTVYASPYHSGRSGALAGLFVYFHDGSHGRYPAAFFYGFYPSHLLFLKILAPWL